MFTLKSLCLICIHFHIICIDLAKLQLKPKEIDICSNIKDRRIYLEFNESGILSAKRNLNNTEFRTGDGVGRECEIEIITCPSCVINLKFTYINLAKMCKGESRMSEKCKCDHIWMYEPPFDDISGRLYCEENDSYFLSYRSQIRSVVVSFVNNASYEHAFTLEFTSERNRNLINISPNSKASPQNQIITSPYFPRFYLRDLSLEYVITCTEIENCSIYLVFTDFQIAVTSFIEFFDYNGARILVTTGNSFRPPIITSSGPALIVRFYANGGTNVGYKANYGVLTTQTENTTLSIDENCGGYVDNLGGGITMVNMVAKGEQLFDCVWIIKPPESYVHLKTHLYLKVVKFEGFSPGKLEITIRQGTTSNDVILEKILYPNETYVRRENIVPISQGFYVGLKGSFNPNSSLAIMYSAFNYQDCYAYSDFLCQNHRCIPSYLICDGFDHCGDRSDEFMDCKQTYYDRKWMRRANFYFPKSERNEDLKTATLIFIVCSISLIALIFALIVLLYRVNNRARNQFQIQSHLQTINDLLEENNQNVIEEIIVNDIPPNYEPPPEYEDVLKIIRKRESRRTKRRKIQKQSSNEECSLDGRPESSLNSEASSLYSYNPSCNNRSSQTTPLPLHVSRSPPPPYVLLKNETLRQNPELPSTSSEYSHSNDVENMLSSLIIEEECLLQNGDSRSTLKRLKSRRCRKHFEKQCSYSDGELECMRRDEFLLEQETGLSNVKCNRSCEALL